MSKSSLPPGQERLEKLDKTSRTCGDIGIAFKELPKESISGEGLLPAYKEALLLLGEDNTDDPCLWI